jgi:hypothetical protein
VTEALDLVKAVWILVFVQSWLCTLWEGLRAVKNFVNVSTWKGDFMSARKLNFFNYIATELTENFINRFSAGKDDN